MKLERKSALTPARPLLTSLVLPRFTIESRIDEAREQKGAGEIVNG